MYDIAENDGVEERLEVRPRVGLYECLWESAPIGKDVIVPPRLRLIRSGLDLPASKVTTVFLKRERRQLNQDIAPRHVRRKLRGEQTRIGPRNDKMHSTSQQPICEELPSFDILNFVQKQMLELAVNNIRRLKDIVQVGSLEILQGIIVKVDVSEANAASGKCHATHNRLAASTNSDNYLGYR